MQRGEPEKKSKRRKSREKRWGKKDEKILFKGEKKIDWWKTGTNVWIHYLNLINWTKLSQKWEICEEISPNFLLEIHWFYPNIFFFFFYFIDFHAGFSPGSVWCAIALDFFSRFLSILKGNWTGRGWNKFLLLFESRGKLSDEHVFLCSISDFKIFFFPNIFKRKNCGFFGK